MSVEFVEIERHLVDGTIEPGLCDFDRSTYGYSNFRHLDGSEMSLPPGASFVVSLPPSTEETYP